MDKLAKLESTIADGFEQFYKVGRALAEIRASQLYKPKYPTFAIYCRDKWDISLSMGYHLTSASDVVDSLSTSTLPTKASHASKLHIIKDSVLRDTAWREVVETNLPVTGKLVANAAKKYYLVENDPEIGNAVKAGRITAEQGYNLYQTLKQLPEYYQTGWLARGRTLKAIRRLEHDFRDEALDILRSGYLGSVPLGKLTERDVDQHLRRLHWERGQQKRLSASVKQTNTVKTSGMEILSGLEIPEKLTEFVNDKKMLYLFPEQEYDAETLGKMLDKYGYKVLYFAVYTKDEPDLRYDDTRTIKPSKINGLKPQYLLQTFRHSIANANP